MNVDIVNSLWSMRALWCTRRACARHTRMRFQKVAFTVLSWSSVLFTCSLFCRNQTVNSQKQKGEHTRPRWRVSTAFFVCRHRHAAAPALAAWTQGEVESTKLRFCVLQHIGFENSSCGPTEAAVEAERDGSFFPPRFAGTKTRTGGRAPANNARIRRVPLYWHSPLNSAGRELRGKRLRDSVWSFAAALACGPAAAPLFIGSRNFNALRQPTAGAGGCVGHLPRS